MKARPISNNDLQMRTDYPLAPSPRALQSQSSIETLSVCYQLQLSSSMVKELISFTSSAMKREKSEVACIPSSLYTEGIQGQFQNK